MQGCGSEGHFPLTAPQRPVLIDNSTAKTVRPWGVGTAVQVHVRVWEARTAWPSGRGGASPFMMSQDVRVFLFESWSLYVDQAGLQLTEIHPCVFASRVLGFWVCAIKARTL